PSGHRLDFADFDRAEFEMRAILRERQRLLVALRFENVKAADDLLRLGERAVGDGEVGAAALHDASLTIAKLLAADDLAGLPQLARPGAIAADDLLHLLGAEALVSPVVAQHQNVFSHDDFLSFQSTDERDLAE